MSMKGPDGKGRKDRPTINVKEKDHMPFSAKTIRTQLSIFKPLLEACSLETSRKGQNKIGELMESVYRRQVIVKEHSFDLFEGAWMIPKDERRQGVILYLHGGGYTCGDLEYAKGFGAALAVQCGVRVFCAAYRLAPEHRYPAALDDSLTAYEYLLSKGYPAKEITVCGESAGGGLGYALSLRLRQKGEPVPGALIGISPWTDLTSSGESYSTNEDADPSMTLKQLDFYAGCYTDDRTDPLVSPLFAELEGMPPSLIFVGGDEIMLSDSVEMHRKLREAGCECEIVIAPERWHGYVLYGLKENEEDINTINQFLNKHVSAERKLRWMPLDNAAKIYPAARRRNWSNVFRLSATMSEKIDKEIMQSALDVTVRRFPSIATRLRRGVFWYYLQELSHAPSIREENSYPLSRMSRDEIRQCAFRVIVYKKRVAVEFFHSLTDGTGAMIFLKSLLAEYIQQRYGIAVPAEHGVVGRLEEPSEEEMEDSFLKHYAPINASRSEPDAWKYRGTPEPDGLLHITCFRIPVKEILDKAHEYNVSLTNFLGAVMMKALLSLQEEIVPDRKKRKHIKLLIPVNLRKLFGSRTMRNFAFYTTPDIDPQLGDYSFDEICKVIHHRMGLDITPKQMSYKIAANVTSELNPIVKVIPLFLKNIVMKAIFDAVGERKSCLSMSNLGDVRLPEVMKPYIERMDFILGIQAKSPNNCGVLSYNGTLYINFIRNIKEAGLEMHFFRVLRDMGIPVMVESNQP